MRSYLAVVVGGLIGTGLRLACDLAFPHADDAFPVETLIVNLAGAFALGWLVGGLWTRPTMPMWLKAGIGPGVLGSFTTLSAVTVSLLVLGREGDAVSWFDSTSVSRRHARIVVTDGKALLEDLASKNGTFLGEVRVSAPVPLEDGAEIRLGSLLVTFRWTLAQPSTETQLR